MAWEKHHVATHEAGHAIMACRLGKRLSRVSIVQDDDEGTAGRAPDKGGTQMTTRQDAGDRALVMLAGYAACVAADLPLPQGGCNNDFNNANWALMRFDLGSLDVWKERAIEIMERDANRRAVALLVERLMKHEEISFDVVEACIAQVDGGPEASS